MAITMLENHHIPPFAVRFVSGEDMDNYAHLGKQLGKISTRCAMENAISVRDGQPVMSYMEYQARQLCPEIDAAMLPKQLIVPNQQPLRDYTQYDIGKLHLVSDTFKQLVESLEPGVHCFWPVELVDEQGKHRAQHHLFLCMGLVDAIIHDPSTKDKKEPMMKQNPNYDNEDYYYYITIGAMSRPRKIDQALVKGRACYRDIHWKGIEMMISDSLKALIDEHKLTGIEYKYTFDEC